MKKELKDYLHFYLGCEVMLQSGKKYTLEPSNIPNNWKSLSNPISGKLLLRPLSDLTEEEENEICKLCLGTDDFIITYRGMGYNEDGHEIHESIKCIKIEIFCEHPKINNWIPYALIQIDNVDNDFPIILSRFEELGKELSDDLFDNSFELTRYLLSKHFDLFRLIEAGLSIDSTTIKQLQ